MRATWILLLVAVFAAVGCATASKMNRLSVGLTKCEVIELLGEPDSTAATEGLEFFRYYYRGGGDGLLTSRREHFVRFRDGKVTAYGRIGDP